MSNYTDRVRRARKRKFVLALTERGLHHVIRKETIVFEGVLRTWPVLYLVHHDEDGGVRATRVEALLAFLADHSASSYSWMRNVARAFGLLVDFSMAVSMSPSLSQWKTSGELERRLLRGFAHALLFGTVQFAEGRHIDWTGLYWRPLGNGVSTRLLSAVTMFFNWTEDNRSASEWFHATNPAHASNNPRAAIRLARELIMRRKNALLGHLAGQERQPSHGFPGVVAPTIASTTAVPAFPAKYVGPMLYKGFVARNGEVDETAQLLAHFLFLYGLRKSEAFHLYSTDIQFVREKAWVFFHHPEYGAVVGADGHLIKRRQYLQMFNLLPRNRDQGRNHAGWKGMQDELQGTPGFSLPIELLQVRFAKLLRRYLLVTRPALMARRSRFLPDHPFLFVSSGRTADSSGGEIGDPYTMSAFEQAWGSAIGNVGRMVNDPMLAKPRKAYGTTPHGARHFFGRFLITTGVDGPVIQRCMHHKSLESHQVYTRFTPAEVNEIIESAASSPPRTNAFRDMQDEFMSSLGRAPAPFERSEEDGHD